MSERCYYWALRNQRRSSWQPQTLAAVAPTVVERVARGARRRRLAERVWRQVAPQEWQALAEVSAVEDGVLMIALRSEQPTQELHHEGRRLAQELVRLVPGVRAVRFLVPKGGSGSNATTAGGSLD